MASGTVESVDPWKSWYQWDISQEAVGSDAAVTTCGSGGLSETPEAHPRFPLWFPHPKASVPGPVPCGHHPSLLPSFGSTQTDGMTKKVKLSGVF